MRTLIFDGKFGYIKEDISHGLIVLCHFEPMDKDKTLSKAARKIKSIAKEDLILVPFAHLFEECATKKKARDLFNKFVQECNRIIGKKATKVIPFGIEKEFFLYSPAKDSAIKFMRF